MKKEIILLILSSLGILFLLILSNAYHNEAVGKIISIKTTQKTTTIQLENYPNKILVFENLDSKLNQGDKVSITIKKNNEDLIATKIKKYAS